MDVPVCLFHSQSHLPCWGRTTACLHISHSAAPRCSACVCRAPDPSGRKTQTPGRPVLLQKNVNETFVRRSRQLQSRWLNSALQRRTQPGDGAVDVEGVDHVSVHQTGRVHECHQAELLLLGGGDLSRQIVGNTWKTQTTCVCRCFLQGSYRCDKWRFYSPQEAVTSNDSIITYNLEPQCNQYLEYQEFCQIFFFGGGGVLARLHFKESV